MQHLPQRISIIGTTGSGKTTLAKEIAVCLDIPHIELDAIHWRKNWEPLSRDEFRSQVALCVAPETWVMDGNYSKVRDIIWGRADTVVWLDYSFPRVFYQLLQRTFRRVLTHEELWNQNREYFRSQFLSRDSLFVWAIKSYPRRKKQYPTLFAQPEYNHLSVFRLQSPREKQNWLLELSTIIPESATLPDNPRR